MKVLAVLLVTSASLFAAEPTPSERLIEAMKFEQSAIETAEAAFEPFLEQMAGQGIPEQAVAKISKLYGELITKAFLDPEVRKQVAGIYDDIFTEAELLELVEFYATPLGQKLLAEQAEITQRGMEIGMAAVEKHGKDFEQKIGEIIEESLAAEGEEEAAPSPEEAEEEE